MYILKTLPLLLLPIFLGACAEDGAIEDNAPGTGEILALVAEQIASLPEEQQGMPWALLLEKDVPPFGIVKILPLGDHGRIDLTRDCPGLYQQLSAVVLHAPDNLALLFATNSGPQKFRGDGASASIDEAPFNALGLDYSLRLERVGMQVLGFEVWVDDERVQSPVQYVDCAQP